MNAPEDARGAIAPPRPHTTHDQIQARVRSKARVVVYGGNPSEDSRAAAGLEGTKDMGKTVRETPEAVGPASWLRVLPEGPRTVRYP